VTHRMEIHGLVQVKDPSPTMPKDTTPWTTLSSNPVSLPSVTNFSTTSLSTALETTTLMMQPEAEANQGINSFAITGSFKKRPDYTVPPEFLPVPKSITSENPMRRQFDSDLLPLDLTEVSAVIQPEETINKTKLFAIMGEFLLTHRCRG
jgi:hypothetical protein